MINMPYSIRPIPALFYPTNNLKIAFKKKRKLKTKTKQL